MIKQRIDQLIKWFMHSRIGRAVNRFFIGQGPLLAAGIAYMALFSLTAAITFGWTVFSGIFNASPVFKQAVIDASNTALPGLFETASTPNGMVDPNKIADLGATSATGLVALVIALVSASSVAGGLRRAIRTMFGLNPVPESMIRKFTRRIMGILLLFIGLVTTAALTLLARTIRDWIAADFSVALASLFNALSVLVPILVDIVVFILFVRSISSIRAPRRDLFQGAVLSAVGAFLLRAIGTTIVGTITSPILAATASLVTIIVWVNLLGWNMLLSCAWTANPPATDPVEEVVAAKRRQRPNYVTLSDPKTLKWRATSMKSAEEE